MPTFIVTCLYDEGLYDSSWVAVEAESKLEIARHMLTHHSRWSWFFDRCTPREPFHCHSSYGTLSECIAAQPDLTPERLLELIHLTGVDGDSEAQLRIFEVEAVPLEQVETDWWKRKEQQSH